MNKTATVAAWLPPHSIIRPADAHGAEDGALAASCGYSATDMSEYGWIRIGTASITIGLTPRESLVSQTVEVLRKRQADLHAQGVQLQRQINSLLSIDNVAVEVPA